MRQRSRGHAREPADAHAGTLKRRAATLLTRSGLIVAAVGDIGDAELSRQLDRAFGGLPAARRQAAAAGLDAAHQAAHRRRRAAGAAKLGADGPARRSRATIPTGMPPSCMNHILGGGGSSRGCSTRCARSAAWPTASPARCAHKRKASLLVVATGSANERVAELARASSSPSWSACARGRDRAGTRRRQDLSQRLAGAVARFVGLRREPAAFHADRSACRATISTGARR